MTKAICFYNSGSLDRRAFTMLGSSAKSDDNAIGFFGTGFKYALAVLLRHGAEVHIQTAEDDYSFYTSPDTFRGKEIDMIYAHNMSNHRETELPFTTHLGANWKLWQAYRELYTNALDEGGGCELIHDYTEGTARQHDVCVYVVDNEFAKIHEQHSKYFLKAETLQKNHTIRCVSKVPDSDNVVYYKTMYTGTQLDKPTHFTYDYLTTIELTEDRTVRDTWSVRHHISRLWLEGMSYSFLIEHLPQVAKEKVYEYQLTDDYCTASDDFVKACAYLNKMQQAVPLWARDAYNKARPFNETIEHYKLNRFERLMFKRAVKILATNGSIINAAIVVPCASLPNDMLGLYKDQVIYIAKEAFERGQMCVLGTLYEEWLHMTKHCNDGSREMQNLIVDKVAHLMLRVYEMETESVDSN